MIPAEGKSHSSRRSDSGLVPLEEVARQVLSHCVMRNFHMKDRDLEAVTLTVAYDDPVLLPCMIRRAYEGGATLGQVLLAVDAGLCLTNEASCCPSAGWAAAHEWAWISRRIPPSRRSSRRH